MAVRYTLTRCARGGYIKVADTRDAISKRGSSCRNSRGASARLSRPFSCRGDTAVAVLVRVPGVRDGRR